MHFFIYLYGGQLEQLYTANFLYDFLIHLKLRSSSSFPNLMDHLFLFPKSTCPWAQLQKGRKIPGVCHKKTCTVQSLYYAMFGVHRMDCVISEFCCKGDNFTKGIIGK